MSLIDLEYVIALAEGGGIAPRWQEVPAAAKIGPADVWRLRCSKQLSSLPVVVLSYPWLDKGHPDRTGGAIVLRPLIYIIW